MLMRCEDQIHVAVNLRHHFSLVAASFNVSSQVSNEPLYFGIESEVFIIPTWPFARIVIGPLGQVHSEVSLFRLCSLIRREGNFSPKSPCLILGTFNSKAADFCIEVIMGIS